MKYKYKQFIRFVVNNNGNGKIKAMNKIVKVYDDEDKFIKIEPPYIFATGTQIDVDMEEKDSSKFMPLRYFKHKDGKIIKKTDIEIQETDLLYQQAKQEKLQTISLKNQQIENNKTIINDSNKTLQEKVEAMVSLFNLKKI